uniref:TPX2 C-terminal domain-containing protein n=1 Tax=Kalanchoe fedtschenkoi TaxID=63787 RepID=A0A7N0V5F9_KALFE
MVESMVEEPVVEGKMRETADAVGNHEVSISFGRFENDLLHWERWSSFSQNKYLEEVEKCSTPGSVAEKKAYFEAHYKKIAAQKAEIEDPQKRPEASFLMPSEPDVESYAVTKASETEKDHKLLEADLSVELKLSCERPPVGKSEIVNQQKQVTLDQIAEKTTEAYSFQSIQSVTADFQSTDGQTDHTQKIKVVNDLNNEPRGTEVDEQSGTGGGIVRDCQTTVAEEKQESEMDNGIVMELEPKYRFKDPPRLVEVPAEADPDINEVPKPGTTVITKLKPPAMTKVFLANRERNVTRAKKAPLSMAPKSAPISNSTPKKSTAKSTTSMMLSSRSSAMKGSNSSVPSSNSLDAKRKKLVPRSDTASPSSSLVRSAPAPVTRKSTFMEKMEDKDIVKRTFKSFQSIPAHMTSPGEQTGSLPKLVPRNTKEISVVEPPTKQKGKEWLPKTGAVVSNGAKATLHVASSRSDTTAHKGKELKKQNGNPTVKVAAGSHTAVKLKEAKETTEHLRHSHNFKATPLPRFYRGTTGASKILAHQERLMEKRSRGSDHGGTHPIQGRM